FIQPLPVMAVTNLANTDLVSNHAGSKKKPRYGRGHFGGCIVRNYSRTHLNVFYICGLKGTMIDLNYWQLIRRIAPEGAARRPLRDFSPLYVRLGSCVDGA